MAVRPVFAMPFVVAALALGCSAVLDDPTPFVSTSDGKVVETPDTAVVADAAPDQGMDAMVVKDAEVEIDRGPTPDAAPDVGPDMAPDALPPDACAPVDEICDGEDNDCDGRVDEDPVDACQPCGPEGGVGICGNGATLCVGGELVCDLDRCTCDGGDCPTPDDTVTP